ncbi:MAG: four-carbon acid sugar kinase family protein [Proteobacteria bacterium]|nr:four-carbon acid sugar kinase family protein [Pseudomonadota bacterium]
MTQALPDGLLIAWYGDDFTGSSAVMEVLTFAGLPSVLFLEPPTPDDLLRFPGMRGVGIASTARAQSPAWMDGALPPTFEWMKQSAAQICHYKTCSTLDSAPHIGSIGRAAEIGARIFADPFMPMLIAAPAIRRYQAFGHLFAGAGDGVFRLDRHPVMARHPTTPMAEADVTLHLAAQTPQRIDLIDLEALGSDGVTRSRLDAILAEGPAIVAFDTMSEADLARVGAVIWGNRRRGRFVLGSQGIEYALVAHFRQNGWLPSAAPPPPFARVAQLPVISGSVSPTTARQIAHAAQHGFRILPFDASQALLSSDRAGALIDGTVASALHCLGEGGSPLICSAQGPDDPAVMRFRATARQLGMDEAEANRVLGSTLGAIMSRIIDQSGVSRVVVSGGDTSGAVTQQLGVRALTALGTTSPGAALFKADRGGDRMPIELALKGGQMGAVGLFAWLRDGQARPD